MQILNETTSTEQLPIVLLGIEKLYNQVRFLSEELNRTDYTQNTLPSKNSIDQFRWSLEKYTAKFEGFFAQGNENQLEEIYDFKKNDIYKKIAETLTILKEIESKRIAIEFTFQEGGGNDFFGKIAKKSSQDKISQKQTEKIDVNAEAAKAKTDSVAIECVQLTISFNTLRDDLRSAIRGFSDFEYMNESQFVEHPDTLPLYAKRLETYCGTYKTIRGKKIEMSKEHFEEISTKITEAENLLEKATSRRTALENSVKLMARISRYALGVEGFLGGRIENLPIDAQEEKAIQALIENTLKNIEFNQAYHGHLTSFIQDFNEAKNKKKEVSSVKQAFFVPVDNPRGIVFGEGTKERLRLKHSQLAEKSESKSKPTATVSPLSKKEHEAEVEKLLEKNNFKIKKAKKQKKHKKNKNQNNSDSQKSDPIQSSIAANIVKEEVAPDVISQTEEAQKEISEDVSNSQTLVEENFNDVFDVSQMQCGETKPELLETEATVLPIKPKKISSRNKKKLQKELEETKTDNFLSKLDQEVQPNSANQETDSQETAQAPQQFMKDSASLMINSLKPSLENTQTPQQTFEAPILLPVAHCPVLWPLPDGSFKAALVPIALDCPKYFNEGSSFFCVQSKDLTPEEAKSAEEGIKAILGLSNSN